MGHIEHTRLSSSRRGEVSWHSEMMISRGRKGRAHYSKLGRMEKRKSTEEFGAFYLQRGAAALGLLGQAESSCRRDGFAASTYDGLWVCDITRIAMIC